VMNGDNTFPVTAPIHFLPQKDEDCLVSDSIDYSLMKGKIVASSVYLWISTNCPGSRGANENRPYSKGLGPKLIKKFFDNGAVGVIIQDENKAKIHIREGSETYPIPVCIFDTPYDKGKVSACGRPGCVMDGSGNGFQFGADSYMFNQTLGRFLAKRGKSAWPLVENNPNLLVEGSTVQTVSLTYEEDDLTKALNGPQHVLYKLWGVLDAFEVLFAIYLLVKVSKSISNLLDFNVIFLEGVASAGIRAYRCFALLPLHFNFNRIPVVHDTFTLIDLPSS